MISRGASLQKWGDDWLKYLNVRKSLDFKLFLFPVKANGANQCNEMPHVSCFKYRLSSTRLQKFDTTRKSPSKSVIWKLELK